MLRSTAALAAASLLCCLLPGCGTNDIGPNLPTVSRTALQEDISRRLADAGEKPQSVTCKQDLVGEVGSTARCEVVVSATNSFEPIISVTAADGSAIEYEMTPAVSREQLEQVVTRLLADSDGRGVRAVSCESGLEGRVGAVGHCVVNINGIRSRRAVEVSAVRGLLMNFELRPPHARADSPGRSG